MTRASGGAPSVGARAAPGGADEAVVWPVAFDRAMAVVLGGSALAMLAPLIALAADPDARPVLGLVLLVYAAIGALVWLLVVPTRYELDLVELRVQAGRFRYRMAWREVQRVELVLARSPALVPDPRSPAGTAWHRA